MNLPPKLKKHATFDGPITHETTNSNMNNAQQQQQPTNNNNNININHNNHNNNLNNIVPSNRMATAADNNDINHADDDDDYYDDNHQFASSSSSTSTRVKRSANESLANENNNNNSQQPEHLLSKLTLSSSLHQLNDSKYHLTNNQNQLAAQQSPPKHQPKQSSSTIGSSPPKTKPPTNDAPPVAKSTAHRPPPQQTKKREANLDTVHVIVGNEACDLDSAVSCLLMFHIISKMSDEINGKDKSRTLYIPLLNTTRELLDSKSEVLWFLQKTLNIDKSFLTCKDDIDWSEIKRNGIEVLVTLVDHNYNEEFQSIGRIVEIIDHHQVQNPDWLMREQQQGIRLTLDTAVGSCATLVAERLFYIYAEHHVSDEILTLIYGTLLLDTICLSEKAARFTRRDVYLLRKLDALLGAKRPQRDQLYRQLVEVKNSTRAELNFERLMRRDLKVYKDRRGLRVGIASLFGMAAREALGLAAGVDLDQFFAQNQYEAFVIMGLVAEPEHSDSISRDLLLVSRNQRLFGRLCAAFEADGSKLDLVQAYHESSPDPEDQGALKQSAGAGCRAAGGQQLTGSANPQYKTRIWLQRNVSSSRKVVAPLVLKVLHDGAASQTDEP